MFHNTNVLNEHLKSIYIVEEVKKDLKKIKTHSKKISKSLKSSNILKVYKSTEFLKDMSHEELNAFVEKKYRADHKISEKYINLKIKKAPQNIKNILITFHSGINVIKKTTKDPEIQEECNKTLERIDKALIDIKKYSKKDGLSTIGTALAIQQLLLSSIFISTVILMNTRLSIIGSCIIASLALLVKSFVDAKKNRKKVIN